MAPSIAKMDACRQITLRHQTLRHDRPFFTCGASYAGAGESCCCIKRSDAIAHSSPTELYYRSPLSRLHQTLRRDSSFFTMAFHSQAGTARSKHQTLRRDSSFFTSCGCSASQGIPSMHQTLRRDSSFFTNLRRGGHHASREGKKRHLSDQHNA